MSNSIYELNCDVKMFSCIIVVGVVVGVVVGGVVVVLFCFVVFCFVLFCIFPLILFYTIIPPHWLNGTDSVPTILMTA